VNELERFFRRLVGNLASTDPASLHRPIPLDDIRHRIVPYRANRRVLALDSSEDYELVLLRLCAGEGHFVRTEPEEARTRFAAELESPNPDLGILDAVEDVVLTLRSEPLARALGPEPERAFAPPRPAPPPLAPMAPLPPTWPGAVPEITGIDEPPEPEPVLDEQVPPHCAYCGGALPAHRAVNFCPHCGQSQAVPVCVHCRGELEPGWRHCVNCGTAVGPA
jgi:hypothetical protein